VVQAELEIDEMHITSQLLRGLDTDKQFVSKIRTVNTILSRQRFLLSTRLTFGLLNFLRLLLVLEKRATSDGVIMTINRLIPV
jgi:hypothetical protein